MWQMLLNSLPFGSCEWGEVKNKIQHKELDFWELKGKVSDSCLDLLEGLLQKDLRNYLGGFFEA